jgi:NIPSNAP
MAAAQKDAARQPRKTRYYLLEQFYLRNGSQLSRIHDFMSQGLLPVLNTVLPGPKIFLEALVAAHMPQFACLFGLESLDELPILRPRLEKNEAFQKAFTAWENHSEAPYEHYSQVLLKATDYSPEAVPLPSRPARPRIYELRVYHSPTWRQLRALHERFAGPEIRIFHRSGVHPLLYTETLAGPNMPNLTYLIPFDSLAAREKAWEAFGSDPEWVRVRKESIDRHGQISSVIQMSLYRAAPYSPIQ